MKKIILVFLILFIISIIGFKLWVFYNINQEQIPVIMYHNVVLDDDFDYQPDTVSVSILEEQFKYLKENNYKTLTLEEFYCWKMDKCELPEKSVLLTFDDGYYSFHYLVEPLLKKYDFYAVIFVVGSFTEDTTKKYVHDKYGTIGKDLINDHSNNVNYQSHSYDMHRYVDDKQRIYTMTRKELKEDLDKMKEIYKFEYISYPFNTTTGEFIDLLKQEGYKLAFWGEGEKATKSSSNYRISRIGIKVDFDEFKSIFETKKYNNRYGNGIIRKVFITIERKFKIRLG